MSRDKKGLVFGRGEDLGELTIGGLHLHDLEWVLRRYGAFFDLVKWGVSEDGYHYEAVLIPKTMQHYVNFLKATEGLEPKYAVFSPDVRFWN